MTYFLLGFIPHARALLAFFLVFWALLLAAPAQAATIRVESGCTLAQAFESALTNAAPSGSTCAAGDASGATAEDTIVLTADVTVSAEIDVAGVTGTGMFTTITTAIRLDGDGHTISRTNGNFRVLNGGDRLKLTIEDAVFRGNRTGNRGALRWTGGDLFVENSVFEGFARPALDLSSAGSIDAEDTVFRNNSGEYGGAIDSSSGVVQRFTRVLFSGNSASNTGGAIHAESKLVIEDSTFINNSASVGAGALRSTSEIVVRNSTFVGNSAPRGGIVLLDTNCISDAAIRLTHVTAVGNTVTNAASGLVDRVSCTARHAPLEIRNSVFTGNTGRECRSFSNPSSPSQAQVDATTITNTYIEDGSCNVAINRDNDGSAGLGSRRTTKSGQVYYVPQRGSLLIDAGAAAQCLAKDQLGRDRTVGDSCDIGAIEAQPSDLVVRRSTSALRNVETRRSGPKPFRETCKTDLPLGISLSATPRGIQCQALTPAGVGNDAVIAAGYLAAVDIWGDIGDGLEVCFDQAGRLILLDAATAPRTLVVLSLTRSGSTDLRLAGSSRHRRPAAG